MNQSHDRQGEVIDLVEIAPGNYDIDGAKAPAPDVMPGEIVWPFVIAACCLGVLGFGLAFLSFGPFWCIYPTAVCGAIALLFGPSVLSD